MTEMSFPPASAASAQGLSEAMRSFLADYGRSDSDRGEGGGEGRWDEGDEPVRLGVYAALARLVRHGLEVSAPQLDDSVGATLEALADQPRRPSARAVELFVEISVVAAASRAANGEQPLLTENLRSFATSFEVFVDDWWGGVPVPPKQPGGSPSR
ncbi:hypothetical protein [Streptomyces sp. NBC_00354]|uniref:hypothetical protein n=1 Tax=Streptomyces sp. NBC_00354 TaxID=2975723 RepID=UPI002E26C6CE